MLYFFFLTSHLRGYSLLVEWMMWSGVIVLQRWKCVHYAGLEMLCVELHLLLGHKLFGFLNSDLSSTNTWWLWGPSSAPAGFLTIDIWKGLPTVCQQSAESWGFHPWSVLFPPARMLANSFQVKYSWIRYKTTLKKINKSANTVHHMLGN